MTTAKLRLFHALAALPALCNSPSVFSQIAQETTQVAQPAKARAMLQEITVRATTTPESPNSLNDSPAAIGRVVTLNLEDSPGGTARLDELLVDSGLAHWDANNSLGLSSGIGLRGFTQSNQANQQLQGSRAYLNGHADIAWRFARNPATVAQVQVLQGHDATLLGAGSPGGAIQYISKTPTGRPFQRLQATASSNGGLGLSFDAEWHPGVFQVRAVASTLSNEKTVERVTDSRSALLLSSKLPWTTGDLRLDLEYHGNAMPFPFGTAYAGGKFWLDQPYVDNRADAQRHYRRQALYLRQDITDSTTLKLHWQRVESTRRETLLGFFDPRNATQLRGYYRLIDERNAQRDAGLRINGQHALGKAKHSWTMAYDHHHQQRAFAGPQNIGGFTLNLVDPVFPANLATLALSPRFAFESYRERGLGAASVLSVGNWELRTGLRRSWLAIDSGASANGSTRRVADSANNTASVGISYKPVPTQRWWLSRAESFQPNRGTFRGGAYLPPSQGMQWELGWQQNWRGSAPDSPSGELALQAFDLRQTNLPARDPVDPDAFVLTGTNRSTGVTASGSLAYARHRLKGSFTQQHVRVQSPTGTQGSHVVGVPTRFGAVTASTRNSSGQWALQLQGASGLAGDSKASFRAGGYTVLGVRWEAPAPSETPDALRWGLRVDNALDRRYVRSLSGADNVWQGERRKLTVWVAAPL